MVLLWQEDTPKTDWLADTQKNQQVDWAEAQGLSNQDEVQAGTPPSEPVKSDDAPIPKGSDPKEDDGEEMVTVKKSDLEAVLNRLNRVEQQTGIDDHDPKAKYTWPRKFNYKLRGGQPVLDYTSKRKDPTKWLRFKNQYGQMTSNHYLELTLAKVGWGTEIMEVEVEQFNQNVIRSDKMEATIMQRRDGRKAYIFETTDFGEITVLDSVIN